MAITWKRLYLAGGVDVPIADGGTGASTAQAAIDTLTAVAAATNEHVLTKDTVTGNAIFKAIALVLPFYTAAGVYDSIPLTALSKLPFFNNLAVSKDIALTT